MFDTKLVEFFKNSSPKERGFFTKALQRGTQYQFELQQLFNKINWNIDIPNDQKYWCIANNSEPQKCPVCGSISRFDNGNYVEYCSQKCYLSTKTGENNNASTSIQVNDNVYPTIESATKSLQISRYLILQNAFREINGFRFYPDHESKKQQIFDNIPDVLKNGELLSQYKTDKTTIKQICELHNVNRYQVNIAYHHYGIDTHWDQIPVESRKLLDDIDYVKTITDVNANETAKLLECSASCIIQAIRKHNLTYTNPDKSYELIQIYKFILSLGFDQQDVLYDDKTKKTGIYPKELDIHILSKRIAIEYNGVYYHRDDEEKHQAKLILCQKKNIRLIQIFEDDWLDNQDLVKRKLIHILGKSKEQKVYARNCELKLITNSTMRPFLEMNHIQGHKNCKECYGLYNRNELVAVMSFSGVKLERFATSCNVVGGFSKLLAYANKTYIETFADLCWSDANDNVYTKNGFKLVSITKPNYFWVIGNKRHSRISFQKHKLKHLPNYADHKSEDQIMRENKAYKIYDAGHAKLVFNK
jgi:hypothetical protein